MNKKIKEIDIKAFRAYKDEQKFDLMNKRSGRVADLVAIYAPNGYGKTSFFDAIAVSDQNNDDFMTAALKRKYSKI